MKKLVAMALALIMICSLVAVHAESMTGGWAVTTDSAVTEDAAAALDAATADLVGCKYEAVALLATQVVAGTNYCLLCRLTPVVPDAEPHYAVVYVWQKLDGTAEMLSVTDLEMDIQE